MYKYKAWLGYRILKEVEPHPVCSSSMQSKKIMVSSEDVFNCRDCIAACFKVTTKFRSLYDSGQAIRFAQTSFYTAVYLESFFYYKVVATAEGTGFWTLEANRT